MDGNVGGWLYLFRLNEKGYCHFLNKAGLCRLVLELGEDALCDICREHPRFTNTHAAPSYPARVCAVSARWKRSPGICPSHSSFWIRKQPNRNP